MKRPELKTLIQEQIQHIRLQSLNETIIHDIMNLILSKKVKKSIKDLKNDPEFRELELQVKLAKDSLEAIAKRIEQNLIRREKVIQDMKKSGIKVDTSMDSIQMYKAYQEWSDSIDKHIKKRGAKSAWENFFNKK